VESDASKAARMANGKRAWEDAHFSRNFPLGCDADECQVCQDLWFFSGTVTAEAHDRNENTVPDYIQSDVLHSERPRGKAGRR